MDIPSYLMGRNASGKGGTEIIVVDVLPATGKTNAIYLVPKQDTGDNDVFDEYIYVNDDWELIGTTEIDLSGYQEKIDSTHKLASDLVDDTNNTNKFVTGAEKTTWNGKLDSNKVKNTNSTTAGDVYDVRYINGLIGDISSILSSLVTVSGGE